MPPRQNNAAAARQQAEGQPAANVVLAQRAAAGAAELLAKKKLRNKIQDDFQNSLTSYGNLLELTGSGRNWKEKGCTNYRFSHTGQGKLAPRRVHPPRRQKTCYNCGGKGHLKNVCTSPSYDSALTVTGAAARRRSLLPCIPGTELTKEMRKDKAALPAQFKSRRVLRAQNWALTRRTAPRHDEAMAVQRGSSFGQGLGQSQTVLADNLAAYAVQPSEQCICQVIGNMYEEARGFTKAATKAANNSFHGFYFIDPDSDYEAFVGHVCTVLVFILLALCCAGRMLVKGIKVVVWAAVRNPIVSGAVIAAICVLGGSQAMVQTGGGPVKATVLTSGSPGKSPVMEIPAKYFESAHLGLRATENERDTGNTFIDSGCTICTVENSSRFLPGTVPDDPTVFKVGSGTMTSLRKRTVRFRADNGQITEFKKAVHLPDCAVNLVPVSARANAGMVPEGKEDGRKLPVNRRLLKGPFWCLSEHGGLAPFVAHEIPAQSSGEAGLLATTHQIPARNSGEDRLLARLLAKAATTKRVTATTVLDDFRAWAQGTLATVNNSYDRAQQFFTEAAQLWDQAKETVMKLTTTFDLDNPTLMGVQIERSREKKGLCIHQTNYAAVLLAANGMTDCKGADPPIEPGAAKALIQRPLGERGARHVVQAYQALGSLIWLMTETLGGQFGTILTSCRLDRKMSVSTGQAETYALQDLVKDTIWLKELVRELGYGLRVPTPLGTDNDGVWKQSKKAFNHSGAKHYRLAQGYIRQAQLNRVIDVESKDTDLNAADIFTKALSSAIFIRHQLTIMGPQQPL